MLISLNLLRQFVSLDKNIAPEELGRKVTLAVAEVEDVILSGDLFNKVKIAQIISIRKHPEAEKLNLVTLNMGNESLEVVCGASNVQVGLKVAFAPLGTRFPSGLILEEKKIRGVMSRGMICSEAELGLKEESQGIMELPSNAEVGQSFLQFLGETPDVLLNIDNKSLTHRPDLWGHFGFAREICAIFDVPLINPYTEEWERKIQQTFSKDKNPISINVDNKSACKAYFGLSLDHVTVTESPAWLKSHLKSLGMKSINNVVDISNFVMVELGIPLHIFDREKISGENIFVKVLDKAEKFQTLDGEERELIAGDTVIADQSKTLVLAGIMGGLESGVTEKTTKIFIEVANWKAGDVRKTSSRLGLRSESSQRYEKSLDSKLCKRTLLRTVELIQNICPEVKVVGSSSYQGENLAEIAPLILTTSVEKINQTLGTKLDLVQIQKYFRALDFKVEIQNTTLHITVPSFRSTKDIECEADLIEEIGRMLGYDNIAPLAPQVEVVAMPLAKDKILNRKITDFWVLKGNALEVMTYPLISAELLDKAYWPVNNKSLKLKNALSVEHNQMRPSLVPSLLEATALNQKNYSEFRLFEMGRCYLENSSSFVTEESSLGVVFYHQEKNLFLEMANMVEAFLASLKLSYHLTVESRKENAVLSRNWQGVHPQEYLSLQVMGKNVGGIASIHPFLLKEFKIKGNVSIFIFDYTDLMQKEIKRDFKYKPLSKFPSSEFDCTVVTQTRRPVGDLLEVLNKINMKEFVSAKVVDTYQLNEEQKTVTLRTTFLDSEKTLSSDFIKMAQDLVIKNLKDAGFPLKES